LNINLSDPDANQMHDWHIGKKNIMLYPFKNMYIINDSK